MTTAQGIVMLAILGVMLGLVGVQLIQFKRTDDHLKPTWDDRPVGRFLLVSAVLTLVVATSILIRVDIDTRDCVEDALGIIHDVQHEVQSGTLNVQEATVASKLIDTTC